MYENNEKDCCPLDTCCFYDHRAFSYSFLIKPDCWSVQKISFANACEKMDKRGDGMMGIVEIVLTGVIKTVLKTVVVTLAKDDEVYSTLGAESTELAGNLSEKLLEQVRTSQKNKLEQKIREAVRTHPAMKKKQQHLEAELKGFLDYVTIPTEVLLDEDKTAEYLTRTYRSLPSHSEEAEEEMDILLRLTAPVVCQAAETAGRFDLPQIYRLVAENKKANQADHMEQSGKLDQLQLLVEEGFARISGSGQECIHTLPPQMTALTSYTTAHQVICRENDLQKLVSLLHTDTRFLLLSSLGGVGKTALAKLLLYHVKEEYDSVGWVPYQRSLKESLLANLNLYDNIMDTEQRWQELEQYMRNDPNKKLLIIDNADADPGTKQNPANDELLQTITGWNNLTVIVTTRLTRLKPYHTYPVSLLAEEDCINLFYHYYELDEERQHRDTVKRIVNRAGRHTFAIELLAKSARWQDSLKQYEQNLEREGFRFPDVPIDDTDYSHASATAAGHLKILFDMQKRTEQEKKILWDISLLPNLTYSRTELHTWLGYSAAELQDLVRDGWLTMEDDGISMHPLVTEIIHLDKENGKAPEGTAKQFLEYAADEEYFAYGEKYTETERKLTVLLYVLEQTGIAETEQFAGIYSKAAGAYYDLGQYKKALEYYRKALAIREEKLGRDHPDTGSTYNNIALVYDRLGQYEKALEYYGKDLAIYEEKLGRDHPDTGTIYNNIAVVYTGLGQSEKALEYYGKALAICEEKLGTDHPDTGCIYNNIAGVYKSLGQSEKALEYYGKALAIKEEKLGRDHPSTGSTYHNIAVVYDDLGQSEKALEYYEKALAICEEKLGKDHPSTGTTYNNIAGVYADLGQYEKALEYYEKALAIREEKLGRDHPSTGTTYNNIAGVYADLGQYEEAMHFMKKAYRVHKTRLGAEHAYTIGSLESLQIIWTAAGRPADEFESWLAKQD